MAETDLLWRYAKADLTAADPHGRRDWLLWEHAERVAHAATRIAQIAGLRTRRIDRVALTAACLYHDVAWALQLREGKVHLHEVLCSPCTEDQIELAAGWVSKRLAGVLPERSLEASLAAIREYSLRDTQRPEAQLLAEADNLDQVGPPAFWLMVRRHTAEGRGIQAAIETWQKQRQYHFWQARIKECFRFEPTRRLAQRRLRALEGFVEALRTCHNGEDLAVLATAS